MREVVLSNRQNHDNLKNPRIDRQKLARSRDIWPQPHRRSRLTLEMRAQQNSHLQGTLQKLVRATQKDIRE